MELLRVCDHIRLFSLLLLSSLAFTPYSYGQEDSTNVEDLIEIAFEEVADESSINDAEQLIQYVQDRDGSVGRLLSKSRVEYISRIQSVIQKQEGYRKPDSLGGYLGNRIKYFQRLKYQTSHISLNLTQEKDAGEQLRGVSNFDFNSIHLQMNDVGAFKKVIIGDYSASFGQGLVLWNGGAFGKGREVTSNISRRERGLKAYSSAQETDFFRGIAVTTGDRIEGSFFYSNRDLSSSIVNDDTLRFPSASGFHRTRSELNRRNNVNQESLGGRLRYTNQQGIIGITAFQNTFDKYISTTNTLGSSFKFRGRVNHVVGADFRFNVDQFQFYGELARSRNSGNAAVLGLDIKVGQNTALSMNYRNFGKDFQSFYSNAFSERSGDPQNEKGFYIGLKHDFDKTYSISAYFDQYSFDSPRTGFTQSSGGFDLLCLLEFRFSSFLNAYVLYRNEIQDDEYVSTDEYGRQIKLLGVRERNSLRTQLEYQATKGLRLRSRLELLRNRIADEPVQYGLLMYQDIRVQLNQKFKLDSRVTVFDTDSFDSRVFQFENDLRYVLTNTVLSGNGQRLYVLGTYKFTDHIELSAKYSVTVFEDQFFISSGLNEIKGRVRSAIGLQFRIKV